MLNERLIGSGKDVNKSRSSDALEKTVKFGDRFIKQKNQFIKLIIR